MEGLRSRQRLRLDFSTANDRIDFTVQAGGKAASRDPIIAGSSSQRQSFASVAGVWESDLGDSTSHRIALGQRQRHLAQRAIQQAQVVHLLQDAKALCAGQGQRCALLIGQQGAAARAHGAQRALDEGPRVLSNIVDCAPEEVHAGMPVQLVYRERDGQMLYLFAPQTA